jgi:hypothetical protein
VRDGFQQPHCSDNGFLLSVMVRSSEQAKEQGIELVGPAELLNRLTKSVLETALDE